MPSFSKIILNLRIILHILLDKIKYILSNNGSQVVFALSFILVLIIGTKFWLPWLGQQGQGWLGLGMLAPLQILSGFGIDSVFVTGLVGLGLLPGAGMMAGKIKKIGFNKMLFRRIFKIILLPILISKIAYGLYREISYILTHYHQIAPYSYWVTLETLVMMSIVIIILKINGWRDIGKILREEYHATKRAWGLLPLEDKIRCWLGVGCIAFISSGIIGHIFIIIMIISSKTFRRVMRKNNPRPFLDNPPDASEFQQKRPLAKPPGSTLINLLVVVGFLAGVAALGFVLLHYHAALPILGHGVKVVGVPCAFGMLAGVAVLGASLEELINTFRGNKNYCRSVLAKEIAKFGPEAKDAVLDLIANLDSWPKEMSFALAKIGESSVFPLLFFLELSEERFTRVHNGWHYDGFNEIAAVEILESIGRPAADTLSAWVRRTNLLFKYLKTKEMFLKENITFILTHRCQSNCKHCCASEIMLQSQNSDFPKELFKKIILEIDGLRSIRLEGGEPFAYMKKDFYLPMPSEDFYEVVYFACERVERVQIVTNAFYFPEKQEELDRFLDRLPDNIFLWVSLDEWHEEQAKILNVDLFRIIRGIEDYYARKRRLGIGYSLRMMDSRYCRNSRVREYLERFGLIYKDCLLDVHSVIGQGAAKRNLEDDTDLRKFYQGDFMVHRQLRLLNLYLTVNGLLINCAHGAFSAEPPECAVLGDTQQESIFSILQRLAIDNLKADPGASRFLSFLKEDSSDVTLCGAKGAEETVLRDVAALGFFVSPLHAATHSAAQAAGLGLGGWGLLIFALALMAWRGWKKKNTPNSCIGKAAGTETAGANAGAADGEKKKGQPPSSPRESKGSSGTVK